MQEIFKLPGILPLAVAKSENSASFSAYDKLFAEEREGYLFLFQPYRPLVVDAPEIAFVDGYYNAYQALYAAKKQVEALLVKRYPNLCGYHGSYKVLLATYGFGTCLHNTLFCVEPFGSFFCVEVLDLLGRTVQPQPPVRIEAEACATCGLCVRACPTGALSGGAFVHTRCMRQWQFETADLSDTVRRAALGNKVLGCNLCQLACPKNHAIVKKAVRPDQAYATAFSLDALALACCKPHFKESPYAKVVGANYAKPIKLLGFVLSAMLAHNGPAHLPTVRACLALENPNAKPLLKQYLALCEAGKETEREV